MSIIEKKSFMEDYSLINIREIIQSLWAKRKLIIISWMVISIIFGLSTLLLEPKYRAVTTIILGQGSAESGVLGNYSQFANLLGINFGGAAGNEALYSEILRSENLLNQLLEEKWDYQSDSQQSLYDIFEMELEDSTFLSIKKRFDNFKKLFIEDVISISVDETKGLMYVAVVSEDPFFAAKLANTMIIELEKYLLVNRTTTTLEEKEFLDKRLAELEKDLSVFETRLVNFDQKNVGWQQSPTLTVERERIQRELQITSSIFSELMRQKSITDLELIRENYKVNVLDSASVPAIRFYPKRTEMTILGSLAILFIVSFLILIYPSISAFAGSLELK